MKTVLLLNPAISTLNLGDIIIGNSAKKGIGELLAESFPIDFPVHTPQFHRYQNMLYKKKTAYYKNADYKFLCGTNALYTNMLRPLPSWNIHMFNASLFQNTILLGVGIGENSKKVNLYTRTLYNKVLSRRYAHSTRDEKAKQLLESLGFRAINTGCPTLWPLTPELCKTIPSGKARSAVFTLTYYHSDIINDALMIDVLKRNYERLYFWPQSFDDLKYLKELGRADGVEIVPPNVESYSELLTGDVDYVGNRLHGGIFALQHAKRSIIIAFDYRVREMKKFVSLPSMERGSIGAELERKINSEWPTRMDGLDYNAIAEWKSQFC